MVSGPGVGGWRLAFRLCRLPTDVDVGYSFSIAGRPSAWMHGSGAMHVPVVLWLGCWEYVVHFFAGPMVCHAFGECVGASCVHEGLDCTEAGAVRRRLSSAGTLSCVVRQQHIPGLLTVCAGGGGAGNTRSWLSSHSGRSKHQRAPLCAACRWRFLL